MITRKYDRDIETLREHFPNADGFTTGVFNTHAYVHITYADGYTLYITMGEYSDGRNYAAHSGDGSGNHKAEFATFAELLTYLDGGKAA